MLTQERLKELLSYNPETGVFVWRTRRSGIKVGVLVGSPNADGYLRIMVDKKRYLSHRLAWFYMYGYWPDKQIDHINRVRTDNRIENLREATPLQNTWNLSIRSYNTSGLTGASVHKKSGKWIAQISIAGRKKHLGLHATAEEAHIAYLEAKEQHHKIGAEQ
jgi:hypothetical protein